MKITSVDLLALERDRGNGSRPVICRINTASGLYGYGEAGIAIFLAYSVWRQGTGKVKMEKSYELQ